MVAAGIGGGIGGTIGSRRNCSSVRSCPWQQQPQRYWTITKTIVSTASQTPPTVTETVVSSCTATVVTTTTPAPALAGICSSVSGSSGTTYDTQCHTNYIGYSIKSSVTKTFEECIETCESYNNDRRDFDMNRCVGVVWQYADRHTSLPYEKSGICYLKNSMHNPSYSPYDSAAVLRK